MSEAVPGGSVGFEENGDRLVGQIEFRDKVLEKGERGKHIVRASCQSRSGACRVNSVSPNEVQRSPRECEGS